MRPSEERLQAREITLRKVQSAIDEHFGEGNYRVSCFGSTAYGLDDAKSDMDLVVLVGRIAKS